MPLYPKRLPGESRPGQPLPTRPSDRPKQNPPPPPPPPKDRLGGAYALMLLREAALVLGGLAVLMVLPWP